MSAFRRRTRFAAPIVITLVAGCSKGDRTTSNPPDPGSGTGHTNNPPAPPPLATTWQVTRATSGTCSAEQDVQCDPGETCNPPPPRTIECPAGMVDKKPLTVTQLADFSCAVVPDGCTTQRCAKPATPCPTR